MKKLLVLILSLLLLSACGSAKVTVDDANEVLFKSSKTSYTKQDLFETLKTYDYTTIILTKLVNTLAEIEELDVETYRQEADKYVQDLIDVGYGELIEAQGGADYIKETYLSNLIIEDLSGKYAKENYLAKAEENHPVYAQYAFFKDLQAGNAAYEEIKAGATFEMTVAKYGYDTDATLKIITDADSTLPIEVKDRLLNLENPGLLEPINTSITEKDEYGNSNTVPCLYLVNVQSSDVNDFAEAYQDYLKLNIPQDEIISALLKRHKIAFYDNDTYKLLSAAYEELK